MYRDKISPLLYKKEINMDHIKVEKEFLDNLFESAAWNQVGVKPVVEEAAPEVVEEESSVVEEAEEGATHSCPVCESTLEEELSDDVLREHLSKVFDVIDEAFEVIEEEEEASEEDED